MGFARLLTPQPIVLQDEQGATEETEGSELISVFSVTSCSIN